MTSDGPFGAAEDPTQNHPPLVTQRSQFQWTASLKAAPLAPGWQDHLTRYLVANAAVSLSFEGQEPLPLLEVKKLDDPLDLYKVTIHKQAAEVQIAYRALSQGVLDAPYDCHLLLKTEVGGRFITLPSPQPPSQAEWKQALKKLWFQLLLTEEALLLSDAPLYTFRLHPELGWEAAEGATSGQIFGAWQRELRLTIDPAHPQVVRAWLVWNDAQSASSPSLDQESLEQPAPLAEQEPQATEPLALGASGEESAPMPALASALPGHERWKRVSRVRLAAFVAAVALLLLIGGIAVGATRGSSGADNALVISKPSPTAGQTPSGMPSAMPSPTPVATTAPTATPAPGSTPRPGPTPTSRPTPTHTPTHTPTPPPTPTPTDTPTPTPTDTPTPTPTDTPTPPPQDTPTP